MLYLIFTILMIIPTTFFCMENPQDYERGEHSCCKGKFGYVLSKSSKKIDLKKSADSCAYLQGDPKTFVNYLCSETETQICDDTYYFTKIQRQLFMQMLLHVHNTGQEGKQLSAQLLQKIADKKIDLGQDPVLISQRDLCVRLLARIPWNAGTFTRMDPDSRYYTLRIRGLPMNIEVRKCVHNTESVKVYTGPHVIMIPNPVFDEQQLRAEVEALLKSRAS